MRHQLTRFKNFTFVTAPIKANVRITDASTKSLARLEIVWVKAHNWHPKARTEEIVREAACLAVDPISVDIASLNRGGPIRIQLNVRDASLIRGEIEIFFNGEERKVAWSIDSIVKNDHSPSPRDNSKFDRFKEDDDDEEDDLDNEGDHDPAFMEMAKQMNVEMKNKQGSDYKGKSKSQNLQIELHAENCHNLGVIIGNVQMDFDVSQEDVLIDSELGAKEKEKEEMRRIDKWFETRTAKLAPLLNLSPSKTKLQVNCAMEGSETKNDCGSQVINEEENVNRKTRAMGPIVALRKSSRVKEDGTLTSEKAASIKSQKDNLPGTTSSFSLFSSLDPFHLLKVANDSGLNLGEEENVAINTINTLQAQEDAHAILAEVRLRIKSECKKKQEEKKKNEEDRVITREI